MGSLGSGPENASESNLVILSGGALAGALCGVRLGQRGFRSTIVLKTFLFEPRNSKTVLFVTEICPRNAKRVLFVIKMAIFHLRNRKLLLRRCRLLAGMLR